MGKPITSSWQWIHWDMYTYLGFSYAKEVSVPWLGAVKLYTLLMERWQFFNLSIFHQRHSDSFSTIVVKIFGALKTDTLLLKRRQFFNLSFYHQRQRHSNSFSTIVVKARLFLLGNWVRLSWKQDCFSWGTEYDCREKEQTFSWGTRTLTERSGKQTTTYQRNTYVRTLGFLHRTDWQLSLLQESSCVLSIRAIRVERRPWNWAVRKDVLGFLFTFMPGAETKGNDDSGSFEFMLAAWTNLQQG